jgi:hypothetical protein
LPNGSNAQGCLDAFRLLLLAFHAGSNNPTQSRQRSGISARKNVVEEEEEEEGDV